MTEAIALPRRRLYPHERLGGFGKGFFELRGETSRTADIILGILGYATLVALWWLLATLIDNPFLFRSPWASVTAIPELLKWNLPRNALFSIFLNFGGYLIACSIALPVGFLLGLFTGLRRMFDQPIAAIRYTPLPAVLSLFIIAFGIYWKMKMIFLGVGILVYLLPVVIQRIDDVERTYVNVVRTLGASKWETVRTVFFPQVMGKLSDDIRVLVAISWTYITIAEVFNKGEGGLGGLISAADRTHRPDMMIALLILIIIIGVLQDRLFKLLDRVIFPWKHAGGGK